MAINGRNYTTDDQHEEIRDPNLGKTDGLRSCQPSSCNKYVIIPTFQNLSTIFSLIIFNLYSLPLHPPPPPPPPPPTLSPTPPPPLPRSNKLKAGVIMNLRAGLKGERKVMEHHQTVARPHNGTPGWWATVWCASTNF